MTALQDRRQSAGLVDGPSGIEFGGMVGAADDVDFHPGRLERIEQRSPGLLSGAKHHVVHRKHPFGAIDADPRWRKPFDPVETMLRMRLRP